MNKQLFEYHEKIGYRFIPDLKARLQHESGGYLVKANNKGFRSTDDFQDAKTPGKKRVLVFGDSFTAGDGVSNKKRYTDLLQEQLGDVEVYNYGLSGTGTDQQYIAYQEYAKEVECDLVVIVVLVENIRRVNARYREFLSEAKEKLFYQKPYFDLVDGALNLKNIPVLKQPITQEQMEGDDSDHIDTGGKFKGLRKVVNKLGLRDAVQSITKYQPLPEFDDPNSKEWTLHKTILKQWMSEIKQPVMIVPLPLYQYVEETSSAANYQARFKELAEETGAKYHDPLPDLLKYPMDERKNFRFQVDIHPTASCHEAYAASLLEPIRSQLK